MTTRTHKASGWTRTSLRDGSMAWRIVPTDGSGERVVRFLSAGSFANDLADNRARADFDRVVLLSGEPLPGWAVAWLEGANRTSCQAAREAMRAAIDDADNNLFGWGD